MPSFSKLFSSKAHHTRTGSESSVSTATSASTSASSSLRHEGKTGWSFSAKLSHLMPHSKRHSTSTSQPSTPPRRPLVEMTTHHPEAPSVANRRPNHLPARTSLAELMHAERKTPLTRQYAGVFSKGDAKVLGEPEKLTIKRHDGTRAGPKLAKVELSYEAKQAEKQRYKQVNLAAKQLDALVTNDARGVFEREIAKGRVPKQALKGTTGLSQEDFLAVITKFQQIQMIRHDELVETAEDLLRGLLPPDATEEDAVQFLERLRASGPGKSGTIEPENARETPEELLLGAMAGLPERRLADIADRYVELRQRRHDDLIKDVAADLQDLLPDATKAQATQFLQDVMASGSSAPAESDELMLEGTADELRRKIADLPRDRLADALDAYVKLGHDSLVEDAAVDLTALFGDDTKEAGRFLQSLEHSVRPAGTEPPRSGAVDWHDAEKPSIPQALADLPADRLPEVFRSYMRHRQERHDMLVEDVAMNLMALLKDASKEEAEEYLKDVMRNTRAAPEAQSESQEIVPEDSAEQALGRAMADLPEDRFADVLKSYEEQSRLARYD